MSRIYYRLSLKKRNWIFHIVLTVLFIAVTGALSYYFASRVMEANALKMSRSTLNKSAQLLNEHMRHIVVSSYTLMLSEGYDKVMEDVQSKDESRLYNDLSMLQTPFAQLKLNEPSIESVLLQTPIGEFYPTKDTRNSQESIADMFGEETLKGTWGSYWVPVHQDRLFLGKKRVLSLILRPFTNAYSPDVYLVINISESYMREMIEQNLINDQVKLFLLNKDGSEVIRPSDLPIPVRDRDDFVRQIVGRDTGDVEYEDERGRKHLVNYSNLQMNEDWILVGVQSKADLLRPMQNIRWLILVIMIVCMLLALISSNLLSSLLLNPLYKLHRLMTQVELNNFNVRFESKYEDEVGQVGLRFNRMIEQIQTLIREVRDTEQEKRKSEVKALQAQVDPHFLYNTLNTIYWKSESGEIDDVKEMIVSLSLLFRLGLNNGYEITTLEKEIEHVRQYLLLQQKCYEDRFEYSIHIDHPSLLELSILKILLQPLVENAILHGFRDMTGNGQIRIEAIGTDTDLVLRVRDNGCGMDVEALHRQLGDRHHVWNSLALPNLQSRLSLYYGDNASLKLHSVPFVETIVEIIIPIPKEAPK